MEDVVALDEKLGFALESMARSVKKLLLSRGALIELRALRIELILPLGVLQPLLVPEESLLDVLDRLLLSLSNTEMKGERSSSKLSACELKASAPRSGDTV